MDRKFRIALAGNPNCGKTSIFNELTGARQHVGNYAGVTVESKSGKFMLKDMEIELIDLPGVYSLSSSSPEEEVVFDELMKSGIDMILNVVDSTIPRRSLYLTTQLAELHIPMFLVFNMADAARKKGMKYDFKKLEQYFGAPIVQTVGSKSGGVQPLLDALVPALDKLADHGMPMLTYGADVDDAIQAIATKIDSLHIEKYAHIPARFFAIKLLEHDSCVRKINDFAPVHDEVTSQIKHLDAIHAIDADTFMADRRYAMLSGACRDTITVTDEKRREISDRIDAVMTNRFLGLPLFLIILYLTFQLTFTCATPFMDWIEEAVALLNTAIKAAWPETTLPFFRLLLADGIVNGVGGVLVFLPNILFLFFAIAILEDTGYMSRAAFVMDGIMRHFGLQGRSFVPLILGFGCNVPAIMATRTIESERDRTVTIMVLPMMSCGARLPIYALIIPAFFAAKYQATVMFIIYMLGVVFALTAARLLKGTLFKGEGEVYLMELPPYRMPTAKSMMLHMWDRTKMYLHKAGTIILFTSIILYLCNTYPQKETFSKDYDSLIAAAEAEAALSDAQLKTIESFDMLDANAIEQLASTRNLDDETMDALEQHALKLKESLLNSDMDATDARQHKMHLDLHAIQELCTWANSKAEAISALENARSAEELEYTLSGRIGKFIQPIFAPLGFDWKLTTANIAALSAKEVFVSQLGILYAQGDEAEDSAPFRQLLRENYTPLQAFCIMVFALLSIPCLATLAVIRRELNSWKMAGLEAFGLFCLAWATTFIIYQLGSFLHLGTAL